MIKIRELIKTESFSKMKLLGDCVWYDNEIDSIGIFEYEAIENQYELFRKGDFVITTLMFAKHDPELAESSLIRLMKQRVSAIAIKDIYYKSVSPRVQAYADKHQIQLMFFNDIPFEDIIVSVTDEIRNKEQVRYYETRLDRLMDDCPKREDIISIINDMNSSFLSSSYCAYCVPKTKNLKQRKTLINGVMQNVRSRKNKGENSIHNSIFRYKKGIFIIHTFDVGEWKNGYLNALINHLGLKGDFDIGISSVHHELYEIQYGVKEAVISQEESIELNTFEDLGIERFLKPLANTYWAESYKQRIIEPIIENDASSSYKLLETAVIFVQHNGELKRTADDLSQHVNTIRYRLNKIKDLMNCCDENGDFYEQLFIAVKLYLYEQESR